jgi:hypothetical protein
MRGFDRSDVDLLRTVFRPDAQSNDGPRSNTLDDFVAGHVAGHDDLLGSLGLHMTGETDERRPACTSGGRDDDRLERRQGFGELWSTLRTPGDRAWGRHDRTDVAYVRPLRPRTEVVIG